MSKTKVELYYKRKARDLVDLLVDKGFVREDVTREETRILDDYIGFLFQAEAQSAKRIAELMRKHGK